MTLSYENYEKLKNIYLNNDNTSSLFSKTELKNVITLLTTIPYYKNLLLKRGYLCLKKICLNMSIKIFPPQTKVKRYNKERTKYYHLLYGNIEEFIDNSGRSALKSDLTLTECCYAKFNFNNYIELTNEDIKIVYKKFENKLKTFYPFVHLLENDYLKLFLSYDELDYILDDIVYKENDEVDGIYLILEGDFEIYKRIIKKDISIHLDKVERSIKYLKRENNYLNHLLNTNYISRNSRNNHLNNQINNNSKVLFFSNNDISNVKVRIKYIIFIY
jgi:hypothetical protein